MNKIRAKLILPRHPYYYVYFNHEEDIQIIDKKPDKIEYKNALEFSRKNFDINYCGWFKKRFLNKIVTFDFDDIVGEKNKFIYCLDSHGYIPLFCISMSNLMETE